MLLLHLLSLQEKDTVREGPGQNKVWANLAMCITLNAMGEKYFHGKDYQS